MIELQQFLHDIHAYQRDRLELENKQKTRKKWGANEAAALVGMASEFVFSFKCFSFLDRLKCTSLNASHSALLIIVWQFLKLNIY